MLQIPPLITHYGWSETGGKGGTRNSELCRASVRSRRQIEIISTITEISLDG
jgi:hypothetical protein